MDIQTTKLELLKTILEADNAEFIRRLLILWKMNNPISGTN